MNLLLLASNILFYNVGFFYLPFFLYTCTSIALGVNASNLASQLQTLC